MRKKASPVGPGIPKNPAYSAPKGIQYMGRLPKTGLSRAETLRKADKVMNGSDNQTQSAISPYQAGIDTAGLYTAGADLTNQTGAWLSPKWSIGAGKLVNRGLGGVTGVLSAAEAAPKLVFNATDLYNNEQPWDSSQNLGLYSDTWDNATQIGTGALTSGMYVTGAPLAAVPATALWFNDARKRTQDATNTQMQGMLDNAYNQGNFNPDSWWDFGKGVGTQMGVHAWNTTKQMAQDVQDSAKALGTHGALVADSNLPGSVTNAWGNTASRLNPYSYDQDWNFVAPMSGDSLQEINQSNAETEAKLQRTLQGQREQRRAISTKEFPSIVREYNSLSNDPTAQRQFYERQNPITQSMLQFNQYYNRYPEEYSSVMNSKPTDRAFYGDSKGLNAAQLEAAKYRPDTGMEVGPLEMNSSGEVEDVWSRGTPTAKQQYANAEAATRHFIRDSDSWQTSRGYSTPDAKNSFRRANTAYGAFSSLAKPDGYEGTTVYPPIPVGDYWSTGGY